MELEFRLENTRLAASQVAHSLETLSLDWAPLRHLCLGLNSCQAWDPSLARWASWTTRSGEELDLLPHRVLPYQPGHLPSGSQCCYRFQAWMPRDCGPEREGLISRAGLAPAALFLNGEHHKGQLPPPVPAPWHQELSQPFYLAVSVEQDIQARLPYSLEELTPAPILYCVPVAESREVFLLEGCEPGNLLPCDGVYALSLGLEGPGSVYVVQDGVLLDPISVSEGVPGAVAMVASEGLQLDASAFRVVRDRACDKLVDRVVRRCADLVPPRRGGALRLCLQSWQVGGVRARELRDPRDRVRIPHPERASPRPRRLPTAADRGKDTRGGDGEGSTKSRRSGEERLHRVSA